MMKWTGACHLNKLKNKLHKIRNENSHDRQLPGDQRGGGYRPFCPRHLIMLNNELNKVKAGAFWFGVHEL